MSRVLLISGSLRRGSTNTALLATARVVAPAGIVAEPYEGLTRLPHFNPDDDVEGAPLHRAVTDLRARIAAADALLLCTPEYAGALPGSLKNLLDWTVGGGETYRQPVAWVNVSGRAAPTGGAGAHDELRRVLGYTGAEIVESACVQIPLARGAIGEDGLIGDPAVRTQIAAVLRELVGRVRRGVAAG